MSEKGIEEDLRASLDLMVRNYDPKDFSFIISSWSKSYKMMSSFCKRISPQVYFKYQPRIIESILEDPFVQVFVACPKEDPHSIFGYIVYSSEKDALENCTEVTLQYLFVKKEFQRLGIGKVLFEKLQIQDQDQVYFTHWTFPIDEIIGKYPKLIYNPYLII